VRLTIASGLVIAERCARDPKCQADDFSSTDLEVVHFTRRWMDAERRDKAWAARPRVHRQEKHCELMHDTARQPVPGRPRHTPRRTEARGDKASGYEQMLRDLTAGD